MRTIIWFSCGAASFACAYLMKDTDALLVYCDTGGEHPDSKRFLADAEKFLSKKVIVLKNPNYADHFDVVRKTRWVNGPQGARCTAELKKKLRLQFQQVDDIQIFGYASDPKERRRAKRFEETFPEVTAKFPLIEKGLRHNDCIGLVKQLGIELPAMYKLGFNNNNCIGCVKGGAGYWNKIRKHFPDHFKRMATLEREMGASCIRGTFLDALDPDAGRDEEPSMNCDFICQSVIQ